MKSLEKKLRFLPTTKEEMDTLGWKQLDVIFVSGDSYVDSPYNGVALLGRMLVSRGFKVGIIAQPDVKSGVDISRLGEPRLYWGVSAGSIDSMVSNYTATKKFRKSDDFTPGGKNDRRPDRAVIVYTNLIKQHFKNTAPIILGGIEASLRRVTHYDFWSNKLRRSVLFDAKADALVYGMGENAVLEMTHQLNAGESIEEIRGLCYASTEAPEGYIHLPSHAETVADKEAFIKMFRYFYVNMDPKNASGLVQKVDSRYLVQNPPAHHLTMDEFDKVHEYNYCYEQHPYYEQEGSVRTLDTVRFSLNSQRGCYGECNFCAITVHQGRTVVSRSQESLVKEAKSYRSHPKWKGIITDVGGPTANMYGYECDKKIDHGVCKTKNCVFPKKCSLLKPDHKPQIDLLRELRSIPGVRKVFVASGLRYDLVQQDEKWGMEYLEELVTHHISGQMKIAPEHTQPDVVHTMGKPANDSLNKFCDMFHHLSEKSGKKQFLTYYFIAAHPGCTEDDMRAAKKYANQELNISPEQIQIFTPTPSTWSSVMYYTEIDPFSGKKLFVEKDPRKKERQKFALADKRRYPKSQHKRQQPDVCS